MSRIYLVTDTETGKQRLVRASNQAQAVRHAAREKFDVEVASQDALVSLVANGFVVESAGADEPPLVDQVIDHVAALMEQQEAKA